MTATELQNLARHLSNQTWCRYWLNYGDRHDDVVMAIQCRDANGKPEYIHGLAKGWHHKGFTENANFMYTIPRTNDDNTPFVSNLF